MLKEFRDFALRGNVLDLAVAVIIGGAFGAIITSLVNDIIMPPIGLLLGEKTPKETLDTRITEAIAMQAVTEAETRLGNHPRDVSQDNEGYDVESFDPRTGRLRFLEVKGRRAGADTVTLTRNEILAGFNSPEQFILAIVEVEDGKAQEPRYVRQPFGKEPDFGVTSVTYDLGGLLARGQAAS